MSREIKEKCKECIYYNDKMEYPIVDGTTTHSNCMSIKCEYRKETKDMKIKRLTSKVTDLEAKLAEKDKQIKELEMAFELCYAKMLYITKEYTNLSVIPSKEHFKQQAKEMLENE